MSYCLVHGASLYNTLPYIERFFPLLSSPYQELSPHGSAVVLCRASQ